MYLKDGREIYECDKFPGYYIDADTGNFCDEEGNYVGGNIDDGDKPESSHVMMIDVPDIVYITKTGKQYYPKPNKTATIPIDIDKAHQKGMRPSPSYEKFATKLYRKALKKAAKNINKKK